MLTGAALPPRAPPRVSRRLTPAPSPDVRRTAAAGVSSLWIFFDFFPRTALSRAPSAMSTGALVFCPDCGRCGTGTVAQRARARSAVPLLRRARGRMCTPPLGAQPHPDPPPRRPAAAAHAHRIAMRARGVLRQDSGPAGGGGVECQVPGLPSHLRLVALRGADDRDAEQVGSAAAALSARPRAPADGPRACARFSSAWVMGNRRVHLPDVRACCVTRCVPLPGAGPSSTWRRC